MKDWQVSCTWTGCRKRPSDLGVSQCWRWQSSHGVTAPRAKRKQSSAPVPALSTLIEAAMHLEKYHWSFSTALQHCFTSLSSQFIPWQKTQDPLLQPKVASSIFDMMSGSLQLCSHSASNCHVSAVYHVRSTLIIDTHTGKEIKLSFFMYNYTHRGTYAHKYMVFLLVKGIALNLLQCTLFKRLLILID